MTAIKESLNEWMIEFFTEGIMNNVEGMFTYLNTKVNEVAEQVGQTPSTWNSSIFSMIQSLSDTVIMPIAGMILTFVMCWELIQMIIDKNNMNDFPPSDIFKWMMKTFIAVLIVTNTTTIIMGIFDVAQSLVTEAANMINSETELGIMDLTAFEESLAELGVGSLINLYLQSFLLYVSTYAMGVIIFIVVFGRMMQIYLMISMGAIPLATMTSKEWNLGNNYIKSILALAFQGFLIMVCMGIYAILMQNIVIGDEPITAIWTCIGYSVLLIFMLFKTGTISKSIFTAH